MRSALLLLAASVVWAHAGECLLFDGTNYPWLPSAFKGAEVGDYKANRTLDITFSGKGSGAQIRILRGDVQPDMREWFDPDSALVIEYNGDAGDPPAGIHAEILALDQRVKPAVKKFVRSEDATPVKCEGTGSVSIRLIPEELDANFIPTTLKVVADGPGRLNIVRVSVRGGKVSPSAIPAPRVEDAESRWLKVDGRRIVSAHGGEVRPFIPVGVGYGKDVILHGYDEEVASYCEAMGLNTIRLAFYNQYFNNRFTEPLEFRDVTAFVDPVIAAAKRHGLYVILDDHAYFKNEIDEENARGEQKSKGWTLERFENWVQCWGRVALRYRDEPTILGYEICNEPVCEPETARKWYKRAIDEIRKYDKRHIVIVGTHHWSHSRAMAATWEGVADKIDAPFHNVVFSFHDYPLDDPPEAVAKYIDAFQKRYNVPVLCTEFGGGGKPEQVHRETQRGMLEVFSQRGIGWMLWTLEDRHDAKPRYWIPFPDIWGPFAKAIR